jgi:hypothetical protein
VSHERLTGTYLLGPEAVVVLERDGEPALSMPGIPEEFAARLVAEGAGFRVEGGPAAGATLTFADGDPCPGAVLGGALELARAPQGMALPGGRGLQAPLLDPTPEEEEGFRALLEEIRSDPDGAFLDIEQPRWRFVEWLTRQDAVIFHGSPKPDIEVFAPVRKSVELMDVGGTGNLAAVYGTTSGLWALWFAVLDRSGLDGSIQNGVTRWTDREGSGRDFYFFSVHHEYVGRDIWRPGTLYLLPRESFRSSPYFPGGPDSFEWASPDEVRPLKRIAVEPDDFPFRDQVGGHDDSAVIEAGRLSDVVLSRVRSARRIEGGLELTFAWDDEVAAVFDDYVELSRKLMPDVERRLTSHGGDEATMEVQAPEGFLQSFELSLARRGIEVESG